MGLAFDTNEWGGFVELDGCSVHDNEAVFDLEDFSVLDVTGSALERNAVVVQVHAQTANVSFEGNGIAYTASAPGGGFMDSTAQLTDNLFRRNGNAIVTEPGSRVELRGNVAVYNTGWGIYAPGAMDLGGNVADAHGRSPQCTGVVCTRPRS